MIFMSILDIATATATIFSGQPNSATANTTESTSDNTNAMECVKFTISFVSATATESNAKCPVTGKFKYSANKNDEHFVFNWFHSLITQSGYNNAAARQFQAQRQRPLNSPVTQNLRQNSFSDGFTEPPSPTAQNTYAPNIFNNQPLRMARQQSIPVATQHLPGK